VLYSAVDQFFSVHRDIEGEQPAASEPVGEPWPDIKSDDAEAQPDPEAGAVSRNVERKFLDDERREKFKEHPVHAVEAQPEAVGQRDVAMRPGELRTIRDSAVIGVSEMLLLKRSSRPCRH
jgi:hypothetical protein